MADGLSCLPYGRDGIPLDVPREPRSGGSSCMRRPLAGSRRPRRCSYSPATRTPSPQCSKHSCSSTHRPRRRADRAWSRSLQRKSTARPAPRYGSREPTASEPRARAGQLPPRPQWISTLINDERGRSRHSTPDQRGRRAQLVQPGRLQVCPGQAAELSEHRAAPARPRAERAWSPDCPSARPGARHPRTTRHRQPPARAAPRTPAGR